ncbi:hypothetical protein DITRI_Ditri17bG0071300 [Diplodiscus trichospermus]
MARSALKILKKTDIEKRMTIPSKSLNRFPPLKGKHTVEFEVEDGSGRVWKFQIYTRLVIELRFTNKMARLCIVSKWRKQLKYLVPFLLINQFIASIFGIHISQDIVYQLDSLFCNITKKP